MGGDFAPHNVVAGVMEALRGGGNRFEVLFVGPESILRDELHGLGENGQRCRIIHAPQAITMDDGAMSAVKQKKDSSIAAAVPLNNDGAPPAFVTAGHT